MIITALCNQAKLDMANGVHQPGDNYRFALYTDEADLGADTRRYTPENESSGPGYPKGGIPLTGRKAVLVDGSACVTFGAISLRQCTFNTAGGMIYNASRNNAALAVVEFDGIKYPSNGAFEVDFPLPTPDAAVIVIL